MGGKIDAEKGFRSEQPFGAESKQKRSFKKKNIYQLLNYELVKNLFEPMGQIDTMRPIHPTRGSIAYPKGDYR